MNKSEEPSQVAAFDVLVAEDIWGESFESLSARTPVRYLPDLWSDEGALFEECRKAGVLVVRNRTQVTASLIEASSNLRLIARAGVGLDNIDIKAADRAGTVVVAALGANAQSVGEHALAMAFALARDVAGNDARTREGQWDRRMGIELAGRTWGVVGLGATGRVTARLADAVGMTVLGYDPYVHSGEKIAGLAERVSSLETLLGRAQFVSLHLPLGSETFRLVDTKFLGSMRSDSFLINSSRGGLVDEDALFEALESGRIMGAALDVRLSEPPGIHPLNRHEKIVFSPHVAGVTVESQRRVAEILVGEIELMLDGRPNQRAVGVHRLPDR